MQIAGRWVTDIGKICAENGIPTPGNSEWFIGGESNGAKHLAQLIPHLPPTLFKATWLHGASHFASPSPDGKNQNILLAIGSHDYGVGNTFRYFEQCNRLGYQNLLVRLERLEGKKQHSAEPFSYHYALQYFKWVADGKPKSPSSFYVDIVNHEILPESQKEWIPEPQRVQLSNWEMAQNYFPDQLFTIPALE